MPSERPSASELVAVVLKGVGQVMFQESAVTGAFFLAGIAVSSPWMMVGGLLGSVIGTSTAILLNFDSKEIRAGLYGFNSALVGIALLFYDQPVLVTLLVAVIGCIAAAIVTRAMRRYVPFPTYTAPFIVTTWMMLALARGLGAPAEPAAPAPPPTPHVLSSVLDGVSEVMFQANWLTGLLFLIGILLCSWRGAAWALAGAILGTAFAEWRPEPAAQLAIGIYGYNAALAAMALALYRKSLAKPVLGAILSVPITAAFPSLGLETLTAPFVLATWLVILLDTCETLFAETSAG